MSGVASITAVFAVVLPGSSAVGREEASWSAPERVSTNKRLTSGLDIAAGQGGYAAIAWTEGSAEVRPASGSPPRGRLLTSLRGTRSRHFRRPKVLAKRGAQDPQVGIGPHNQTVVSWLAGDRRVRVLVQSSSGGFGKAETLSGRATSGPQLSVGFDGTSILAWFVGTGEHRQVQAAVRPPGRKFREAQTLDGSKEAGPFMAVAAGGGGHGAVAWSGPCPSSSEEGREPAQAAVLLQGSHRFGPAESIPNSKCPNAGLELAMDQEGAATALINGFMSRGVVKASTREAGRRFGAAERISRRGVPSYFGHLGVALNGKAVAAWDAGARGIMAAARPSGANFLESSRVSSRGNKGSVNLEVAHGGDALVVWQSPRTFKFKGSYTTGTQFRQPERISPPLGRSTLSRPLIAISPAGKAFVAWSRSTRAGESRGVYVVQRRAW